MTYWQAVLLAIVEGITEFLPISSTGHLILLVKSLSIPATSFVKSFEVAVQLGAIVAVGVVFWRRLLTNANIAKRVLVAWVPTAILGFLGYGFVKSYLLSNPTVVVVSLLMGGVMIILLELRVLKERQENKKIEELSWLQCVVVGVFQAIAMVPGVSRSAATIIGGMMNGLSRTAAVEMSFLLAIPTMAAAVLLDLVKSGWAFSSQEWMILGLGGMVAFISAWVSVEWLLKFVRKHSLIPFGVYRILLAVVWWIMIGRLG